MTMHDRNGLFAPKVGLTMPLCGLHFIFFFLVKMDPVRTFTLFGFDPKTAFERPWTFLTYQFLHEEPFALFFGTLVLYILGSALEMEWGTAEFTVFWLVSTLGTSLAALVTGNGLDSGGVLTGASLLFAYAYLFPDMQFLIFFVIPVKVKWLAWLAAAGLAWGLLQATLAGRPGAGFVGVAGAGAGFVFFWIRHHGGTRAKKAAKLAVVAVKTAGAVREDAVLERRNRELFPKVEDLRRAMQGGGDPPPRQREFASELAKLVVPGVNVCKPVDFKGDRDGICVKCEGFAECSLRYVAGQPAEIVLKTRA
jgi:membrane associated rhomboid family serine protease